jgi:hypothetical protein
VGKREESKISPKFPNRRKRQVVKPPKSVTEWERAGLSLLLNVISKYDQKNLKQNSESSESILYYNILYLPYEENSQ